MKSSSPSFVIDIQFLPFASLVLHRPDGVNKGLPKLRRVLPLQSEPASREHDPLVRIRHIEEADMSNHTPREDAAGATESRSVFDIRAREAQILGKPPRIPPLKAGEL